MANRIFLTEEQAIDLLPEGNEIHTFYNAAFGLIGADWSRDELLDKIRRVDYREITGNQARGMKHGLALWSHGSTQGDILFVETDMEKLDKLYPAEEEDNAAE